MQKAKNKKRLNRKSYALTMLFVLPVFILARTVGVVFGESTDEYIQGFGTIALLVALILVVFIIIWTIRRLHDLNKSGWFSLLLIPPFTLPLLIYTLFYSAKDEANKWGSYNNELSLFNIRAKGAVRIICIALIGILLVFLGLVLYAVLYT